MPFAGLERRRPRSSSRCSHCPYHAYYPGWPAGYPPAGYPPPHYMTPEPERDDYIRRLESERELLEKRLRRVEEQLAELQRAGRAG